MVKCFTVTRVTVYWLLVTGRRVIGHCGMGPDLKVVAEAELQRLGGERGVPLQQVDLGHEEVGVCMGRPLVQAALQTPLGQLHVPWRTQHLLVTHLVTSSQDLLVTETHLVA